MEEYSETQKGTRKVSKIRLVRISVLVENENNSGLLIKLRIMPTNKATFTARIMLARLANWKNAFSLFLIEVLNLLCNFQFQFVYISTMAMFS